MSYKKNEFKREFLKNKNVVITNDVIKHLSNYTDLITDWSGIYFEFAYLNKRKPILIQTNKKIRNNFYTKINSQPIELYSRDIIGKVVELESINEIPSLIIERNLNENDEIKNFFDVNFY